MLIFWIALPLYMLSIIVAFTMDIRHGLAFIGLVALVTFLLYFMFFHSTLSALVVVVVGVLIYLLSGKN